MLFMVVVTYYPSFSQAPEAFPSKAQAPFSTATIRDLVRQCGDTPFLELPVLTLDD